MSVALVVMTNVLCRCGYILEWIDSKHGAINRRGWCCHCKQLFEVTLPTAQAELVSALVEGGGV